MENGTFKCYAMLRHICNGATFSKSSSTIAGFLAIAVPSFRLKIGGSNINAHLWGKGQIVRTSLLGRCCWGSIFTFCPSAVTHRWEHPFFSTCGLELVKMLMNLTWSWSWTSQDILLAIIQAIQAFGGFLGSYSFGPDFCPRFYVFIAVQGAGLLLSNNFSQIVKAVSHDPHASSAGHRPSAIWCDMVRCPWWTGEPSYLRLSCDFRNVEILWYDWVWLGMSQNWAALQDGVTESQHLGPNPWFCRGQEWVDGDAWVVFNGLFAHPCLIVEPPWVEPLWL